VVVLFIIALRLQKTEIKKPPVVKDNPISYTTPEEQPTQYVVTAPNKEIYTCSVEANEELNLKFPYDGDVTVTLVIRNKGGENEAFLKLSKGQFTGGYVMARFDDSKARSYATSESNDGDNTYSWIDSGSDIFCKK
jgi:hypothetical protein